QGDLAGGGQVADIALEVPLAQLPLVRLWQRHYMGAAGVEMLGEAADRAALAGGVAPLEDDDDAAACLARVILELQKLYLQVPELALVALALHRLVVGISARGEGAFRDSLGKLRVV